MITQGAGGNTSVKEGDSLIIKASGMHLKRALEQEIFVSLDLRRLHEAIEHWQEYDFNSGVVGGLRGSIETPLHAAIRQRVVIHVHSVRTLAFAIRQDACAAIAPRMLGLKWAWVPYAKPGWPLTWELLKASAEDTDVWILQNHGLIVAADSCQEVKALLAEVERRLDLNRFTQTEVGAIVPDQLASLLGFRWRVARSADAHRLAGQAHCLDALCRGVVCPDQAVFLGERIVVVDHLDDVHTYPSAPVLLVRGCGVLVAAGAGSGAEDVLTCLGLVAERLEPGLNLSYLPAAEVGQLLAWDAEKYRQLLDKSDQA
jgi:rhamnose utilization protein RhaD (predicted bifunctional aldolase and dehydrogenase)